MGDAYECLAPNEGNVPDAPPAAPDAKAPDDKGAEDPAAPGQPGNAQPVVAPKGGLPLRDDDLDFASKHQTLEAPSKEKTKMQTKTENEKITIGVGAKIDVKKEEEGPGSNRRLAFGMIIGGAVSVVLGLILIIVGIVLAVI